MTAIRILFFGLLACALSACSINELAEKIVPEHILEKNNAVIENVLAANMDYFPELSEDEAADVKTYFEENTSKGKVLRQDFVSASSNASVSTGQGRSKNIDLTVEVQTEEGFTLISTKYALDKNGECCALRNVTAQKFEASPVRASLETMMMVFKVIGGVVLLGLLGLIYFIIRKKRRKNALTSPRA